MSGWERALGALAVARKDVFFTGAGISAASGIPTFRDKLPDLWEKHEPERLQTATAFRKNPQPVWGCYLWRRSQASQAEPNAADLSISSRPEAAGGLPPETRALHLTLSGAFLPASGWSVEMPLYLQAGINCSGAKIMLRFVVVPAIPTETGSVRLADRSSSIAVASGFNIYDNREKCRLPISFALKVDADTACELKNSEQLPAPICVRG